MARQLRTSSVVLIVIAAVLLLLGIGLCGKTSHPDDFSAAAGGAFLLLVALILTIVALVRGIVRKNV